MQNKQELMVLALQERIGQMVAEYETKVAMLRAEITFLLNENEQLKLSLSNDSEELEIHSV